MHRLLRLGIAVGSALALVAGFVAVGQAANFVAPGLDLLHTEPGTTVDWPGQGLIPFQGNPSAIVFACTGGTGNADTIVERLNVASIASPTIPIEIVALELVSVSPVDIGNGPEDLFVSLNADLGGSQMTINGLSTETNPHGTFDSTLDFAADLRGSVSGFIATQGIILDSTAVPWNHGPGGITCGGPGGFVPFGTFTENKGPADHVVSSAQPDAPIPALSPQGLVLFGLMLVAAMYFTLRRRRLDRSVT